MNTAIQLSGYSDQPTFSKANDGVNYRRIAEQANFYTHD